MFVKPLDEDDSLVAFRYGFTLEGKAVEDGSSQIVTEDENGDLIIEGWAAVFEGEDRQGENFADGAFKRGIKSFLNSSATLAFHHKHDHGIGKVLELDEVEGKGLHMKARVDYQPESSPLRYIYNGIKKGTYNALSVGGFFKRAYEEGKRRIVDTDLTEISVTPVAVHPGTSFGVLAGKALSSDLKAGDNVDVPDVPAGEIRQDDYYMIQDCLDTLERVIEKIKQRNSNTAQ
jgi:HK97 family phage prohead protease